MSLRSNYSAKFRDVACLTPDCVVKWMIFFLQQKTDGSPMSTSHRNDSSPVRRNPHVKKIISEPAKRMAEAMPHKLLDTLVVRLRVKNDADLCRLLDLLPPFLSRIRHRKNPLGPGVLLHIHETTGIPIAELKALLAASN